MQQAAPDPDAAHEARKRRDGGLPLYDMWGGAGIPEGGAEVKIPEEYFEMRKQVNKILYDFHKSLEPDLQYSVILLALAELTHGFTTDIFKADYEEGK